MTSHSLESGPNHHPIFVQQLSLPKGAPSGKKQERRSRGGAHYYINDPATGMRTRVYLHNYFSLLTDADLPAKWRLAVYGRDGAFLSESTGRLSRSQTAIVELAELPRLDQYGMVFVHIDPEPDVAYFTQPLST